MKECKVIHINDGNSEVITNGNRLFVEEFDRAGQILSEYLNEGWNIEQMLPCVTPSQGRPGEYTFYNSGFTAVLVRES